MSPQVRQLHVVFFPFMAPGHSIPMLDMVGLFAARDNVKSTLITTPLNAANMTKSIENLNVCGTSTVDIHIIPFPSEEAGLPPGLENLEQVTTPQMSMKFIISSQLLEQSLERFMEENRPDCLVADFFFPFTTEMAARYGIPRLVFHGIGVFATCAEAVVKQYEPYKSVSSEDEPFILPTFPHEVKLTKSQIMPRRKSDTTSEGPSDSSSFFAGCAEAALKSYGVIFNSFYELESDYIDYFSKVLKRRGWYVGPVSLSNRQQESKFCRGKGSAISEHKCLDWLNSKEPNSVIYICFGTTTKFSCPQLKEVSMALESSGYQFIWVMSKRKEDEDEDKERLLDGFEEKMGGRGLIVRGWAPQVLILEHKAVGGFVTHCGWNSTLEGISAGVPMVTWPICADQFYNEKLVTDILKIGVQVGSIQDSYLSHGTFLNQKKVEVAFKAIMEGDEALEMRERATKLKDLAREAVQEGGSSYCNLTSLIQELHSH